MVSCAMIIPYGIPERHCTVLWIIVPCMGHIVRGMRVQGTVILVVVWGRCRTCARDTNSCARTEDRGIIARSIIRWRVFSGTPYWVQVVWWLCWYDSFVARTVRWWCCNVTHFGAHRGRRGHGSLFEKFTRIITWRWVAGFFRRFFFILFGFLSVFSTAVFEPNLMNGNEVKGKYSILNTIIQNKKQRHTQLYKKMTNEERHTRFTDGSIQYSAQWVVCGTVRSFPDVYFVFVVYSIRHLIVQANV